MTAEVINPFISSFGNVLPCFGFSDIKRKAMSVIKQSNGKDNVIILLGVVGDYRGSVLYRFSEKDAKKIASKMIGYSIENLDDMSKSALSELTNMLTANASTFLSEGDIKIDITVPILIYGDIKDVQINFPKEGICLTFGADDIEIDLEISLKKI